MSYHSTQHRVSYTQAMAFIKSHGHFANITKDGLLATSQVKDTTLDHGDDNWFDETHLFAVDENGAVSSREVRNWLGY